MKLIKRAVKILQNEDGIGVVEILLILVIAASLCFLFWNQILNVYGLFRR